MAQEWELSMNGLSGKFENAEHRHVAQIAEALMEEGASLLGSTLDDGLEVTQGLSRLSEGRL